MKVQTFFSEEISTIQIFSYDKTDYKQLISLMKSMGDFYPWYYYEKNGDHVLVYYGGWIKNSDNSFNGAEWEYEVEIKDNK